MDFPEFRRLFHAATEGPPYGFQVRYAESESLPQLVNVPTGAGKTALVILSWLWRRQFAPQSTRELTPRRLVYCLPMRTLVEQTRDNALNWLQRVDRLAGIAEFENVGGRQRFRTYKPAWDEPEKIAVSVLMGGEKSIDWDLYPERDAILIGTQDMLLSRALNRGYGMSRNRWPMHFGLLNNDCLWVFDEVQLMGSGVATTAQLEAFRKRAGSIGKVSAVWMSATLRREWLATVDYAPATEIFALEQRDQDESDELRRRMQAKKQLSQAAARMEDARGIAAEAARAHKPASRTLVVINTVKRAAEVYAELKKIAAKSKQAPARLILLHSRFRPADRERRMNELLEAPPAEGTIIVATQVVEAGVDVSAKTLFTELAPWASLVQRFGRCNRTGDDGDDARVYWIDVPDSAALETLDASAVKQAAPYAPGDLAKAREQLLNRLDVGPNSLSGDMPMELVRTHVIRWKDMLELFDTTPDLAGNDVDADRYVRDVDDSDVQVFWRDVPADQHVPDSASGQRPRRPELCRVPVGRFREFMKGKRAFRWDFLERKWARADPSRVFPGQVYLVSAEEGGYDPDTGWDAKSKARVEPLGQGKAGILPEGNSDDPNSQGDVWQTVATHTQEVCTELAAILGSITVEHDTTLRSAARWHDWGKAHDQFQKRIKEEEITSEAAKKVLGGERAAKAPKRAWRPLPRAGRPNDLRPGFRHELASALGVLQVTRTALGLPEAAGPVNLRDLAAYLIAAHHGKVRLSIRSLPDENRALDGLRFARGVWDGDTLPQTPLGAGVTAKGVVLSLELMELGSCENEASPFFGQPSWAERMLTLRDSADIGPFRLAYLESLLRAADMRASQKAGATTVTEENNGDD